MMKKRAVKWLLLTLLATGAIYIAICGPKSFAKSDFTVISPKGHYRLEFLAPGFLYVFGLTKEMPEFVRLYDNRTGKMLAESDIVDLSNNGEILWPSKLTPYIHVGGSVEFFVAPE
jgi:hypothetical protein